MRKVWVGVLVTAALVLGVAVGASADSIRKSITVDYAGYKITMNGKAVDTGNSQPFLVVDEGRTYVPARYLAEALGAKVGFDATTNTVAVVTPDYIARTVNGDVTSYKIPYYGASIQVPSNLVTVKDSMNLLNLGAADSEIVLNLKPLQAQLGFSGMVDLNLQNLKNLGMLSAVSAPKEITVPGATHAVEYTGTMQLNTLKYPARFRFVTDDHAFWMLLARYDAASDPDGAKAAAILDTFTINQ